MQHKKPIVIFFIFSIIFIGIIPAVNVSNNRNIKFEDLYSTDLVESYINYSVYKIFNISMVSEDVIAGKEDFLFLGNKHNKILHKTQNLYNYDELDIDKWTEKLKALQQWYEERGIKFVMVVAPNKHTIYPENLPDWLVYKEQNLTNEIYQYSKSKNINLLDVRPILLDYKERSNELLYLEKDTHWNGVGASLVYNETIKYLNDKYNSEIKIPEYSLVIQDSARKDLTKLLKIKSFMPQINNRDKWYDFKIDYNICLGNIDEDNFTLNKCKIKLNPVFDIYRQSQYTVNYDAVNDENLLMLCDSFGTQNSQLYNATFKNIWKLHYNKINGDELAKFVSINKPDVVIYQVAERNFYNQNLVKGFSNIRITNLKIHKDNNIIFDVFDKKFSYRHNSNFSLNKKELTVNENDTRMILSQTKTDASFVVLQIEIYSGLESEFQLFYKKQFNESYNEKNSFITPLKKGTNKINIEIPSEYINNQVRIDLVNKAGHYQLNQFKIFEPVK